MSKERKPHCGGAAAWANRLAWSRQRFYIERLASDIR